jgi:hypothetical protein
MAAQQTFNGKPDAAQGAIPLQGLYRVLGTWRVKATMQTQKRTDRVLITTNQRRKNPSHHCTPNARPRSAVSDSSCGGRPLRRTTTSCPNKHACLRRNHSRITRLTRLRSTARGRKRLATTRPSREKSSPFGFIWTESGPERRGREAESTWTITSPRSRCAFRYRSVRVKRRDVPALSHAAPV